MKERIADRPIVIRDVVQPNGAHALGVRVFCPRHSRSVDLDTCRTCPRCVEISRDASGSETCVRCTPGTSGSDPGDFAVGAMVLGPVSAVRHDVPEHAIRALFVKHGLAVVFVVDDTHRVVGVVREADLLHRGFSASDLESAAEIMSPSLLIREDTAIRVALLEMAGARVRYAPVVTFEGEPLGTLIDVAGMRWLRAVQDDEPDDSTEKA